MATAYCGYCGKNTGFDRACDQCKVQSTPRLLDQEWLDRLDAPARKYAEMGAWNPVHLMALDMLLDLVEDDPVLVLRECDRIRNLGWCMHDTIWNTVDAIEALAREELNKPREYWRDADVSDVFETHPINLPALAC